jgi:fluoroquinolone transport system permease protein
MNALSVFAPRRFGRLFFSDALNVVRDPTLIFATLFSLMPAVAFHLGKTPMDEAAEATFGIVAFSRYVAPVALCLPAYLIGWVTGFLFLEDRDEGTLMAIDITPVGKAGFMGYRVAITVLITLAVTIVGARLVVPEAGWPMAALLALLIALQAVQAAFILPSLARNKVEGLAVTKLVNMLAVAPLLAIVPSPWRYLAGIVPAFWIGEMFALSGKAYLLAPVVAGLALATHVAAAWLLYRLMRRRAG